MQEDPIHNVVPLLYIVCFLPVTAVRVPMPPMRVPVVAMRVPVATPVYDRHRNTLEARAA